VSAEERESLLLRLSPQVQGQEAWLLLEAWNHQEAWGGRFPDELTDDLLSRLHSDEISGKQPGGLPLLYRFAREGNEDARGLLQSCVRRASLKRKKMPSDLQAILFAADSPPPTSVKQDETTLLQSMASLTQSLLRLGQSVGPLIPEWKINPTLLRKVASGLVLSLVVGVVYVSFDNESDPPKPLPDGVALFPALAIDGGFTIQTMATRDSMLAVERSQELKALGYWSYYLSPREGRKWYRVRLGHFAYRAEADSLAMQLKEAQLIEDYYLANFQRNEPRHEPQ
jgi:hypothetical protein